MKYYLLTLKQDVTGIVRTRKVYWNTHQFKHWSLRLNEPVSGLRIVKIEEISND